MAEYIDRKKVMQAFSDYVWNSNHSDLVPAPTWNHAVDIVRDMPVADVQPVVHGEWVEKEVFEARGNVDMLQSARCNKCNKYHTTPYSYYFDDYNFCPNCGADMRT